MSWTTVEDRNNCPEKGGPGLLVEGDDDGGGRQVGPVVLGPAGRGSVIWHSPVIRNTNLFMNYF